MAPATLVRGLVYHGRNRPPTFEELLLDPPGTGEVQVRMVAAGVCHSDLHVVDGDWDRPAEIVLGHEGAGIVETIGPDVRVRPAGASVEDGGLRVGDLVALTWTAPCGTCPACVRGEGWLCVSPRGSGHRLHRDLVRLRRADGRGVGVYSGIGTFCSRQVVAAEAAVAVDPRTPPEIAALIGCAASTGIGAVRNTAVVRKAESVVIMGLGGVGLSALLAALDAEADPVIAVDLEDQKRKLALRLGATHAVHPDDLPALVSTLPSSGSDHVFECVGLAAAAESALRVVRPGGTVTLVGMPDMGSTAAVDVYRFVEDGKRLQESNYGSSVPARDFPRVAAEAVSGRLPLAELITRTIDLDDIDGAFAAMRRRDGGRHIIRFEDPTPRG